MRTLRHHDAKFEWDILLTEIHGGKHLFYTRERIHLPIPWATLAVRSLVILSMWQMFAIVGINSRRELFCTVQYGLSVDETLRHDVAKLA